MDRFVRYLYEHRDGKRIQNVGFVKVEALGNVTVIQIYGKGFPATLKQPLEIFLFYTKDDACIGIPMGQMGISGTVTSHKFEVTNMKPEICGLILRGVVQGKTVWYAAVWEERFVDVEHMVLQEEKEDEVEETEKLAEDLAAEPEKETTVHKITRQDLVRLPRKEWKLANNHFLIHGCRNFHHLVSFEKDDKCWLGVPGIYHPNEVKAAEAFGFGQFMKPEEGEISLSEEEYTEQGEFGYWCRTVSKLVCRNEETGE